MNDRDPNFAEKAVAIIELLLSPPTDGPLFCVDEKPGIGVRRPTAPDQPPVPRRPPARGRPARREFEYVRNGTVDLLAGFRVNDGQVYGMVRLKHRSREFCELLALLDEQTPADLPIHVILDTVSSPSVSRPSLDCNASISRGVGTSPALVSRNHRSIVATISSKSGGASFMGSSLK